ncbi:hypothetical protein SBRCBS47491_002369 [Sporothrix bragantina]|uniref:FAD-binding PCMH-type domain-containing protein n=1 Tax=Sporothrix bragantina TaxID=671064 RepID=A0ABP0B7C7_9PEZI
MASLIDYSSFFDYVSSAIGADNVSRDGSSGALAGPSGQTAYGDLYPLGVERGKAPVGGVRPQTVQEVQDVLRAANKFGVPLWVVSRGKNLGYGGTAGVLSSSVTLDLHRMNRIIEINEELAYAIVEPGVSFFDLYEEVTRRKLKLWPSVPAIGWGSVVGNTLDRGFGYTPDGEHASAQCGMEVVLPNGEVMRTGMGAMTDSKLFALYKPGFGPSVDGLFYQSNLGIVTKIGIQMTPAPEAFCSVTVSVSEEADLVSLVDKLGDLMRRRIITNSPSVSNVFRQLVVCPDPEVVAETKKLVAQDKAVPYETLEALRKRFGWGFWKADFALYGTPEIVHAQLQAVQRAFAPLAGARVVSKFFASSPAGALSARDIGPEEIPHAGMPTLAPLMMMNSRGVGCGHISFSPLIPPCGRDMYEWYLAAKAMTSAARFDFFADFHVYPRYIIAINLVVFADAERDRVHGLFRQLLDDGEARGYSEYRTHVSFMDEVAKHFDFNNGALRRFVGSIKDMVDPNHILSPGKSGIWGSAVHNVPARTIE